MADEENWIKEKEQIVSVDDIGHDLTTGELHQTIYQIYLVLIAELI